MKKRIKQLEKKITGRIKKAKARGILPFTERPSEEQSSKNVAGAKDNLGASDLFSLFTADIIKEGKLFTR